MLRPCMRSRLCVACAHSHHFTDFTREFGLGDQCRARASRNASDAYHTRCFIDLHSIRSLASTSSSVGSQHTHCIIRTGLLSVLRIALSLLLHQPHIQCCRVPQLPPAALRTAHPHARLRYPGHIHVAAAARRDRPQRRAMQGAPSGI